MGYSIKLQRKVGTTGQIVQFFVEAAATGVPAGTGLGSLAFGTSGLICYYKRNTGTASVAVSLVTMTLGTWVSGGFKNVDNTNMVGICELCVPNAALAPGADSVVIVLAGAANMLPVVIHIELTQTDNQDGAAGGMSEMGDISEESINAVVNGIAATV